MNNTDGRDDAFMEAYQSFTRVWRSNAMVAFRVTLYTSIIVAAFFGNTLVLITISFTKKMRTITNFFLMNMAVGDLMVSITCMPIELVKWFYSISTYPLVCKTMPFFQGTSVGVSVYTLIVMAVDRYLAIMSPMGVHFSTRQSIMVIGGVWITAALTASPTLFVMKVQENVRDNATYLRCDEYGWNEPGRDSTIYTLILVSLHYVIPLAAMVYIYSRISVFLWFRKIPGEEELSLQIRQKVYKKHKNRKRTIKLLLSVVSAFMLCHLPQNIMSIIWYVFRDTFDPPHYMQAIAFSSEMLMYLNSCLNPILYAFLHKKFKENLQILGRSVCQGKQERLVSIPVKSRTTTLISLRTRSSCQRSGKILFSPSRRAKLSLQNSKSNVPSKHTVETQNI